MTRRATVARATMRDPVGSQTALQPARPTLPGESALVRRALHKSAHPPKRPPHIPTTLEQRGACGGGSHASIFLPLLPLLTQYYRTPRRQWPEDDRGKGGKRRAAQGDQGGVCGVAQGDQGVTKEAFAESLKRRPRRRLRRRPAWQSRRWQRTRRRATRCSRSPRRPSLSLSLSFHPKVIRCVRLFFQKSIYLSIYV